MNEPIKLPPLDTDLHLRIPKDFEMNLARVAATYNMRKSTLCRIILQRELNNYSRNRLFAWVFINDSRRPHLFVLQNLDFCKWFEFCFEVWRNRFVTHLNMVLNMNEKEIASLAKKSLFSTEFSHKNKDNVTTTELNNLCASVKKQLRLKNDVVVMMFEVKNWPCAGFSKSAQDPHISSSGGMCDLKGSENKYFRKLFWTNRTLTN